MDQQQDKVEEARARRELLKAQKMAEIHRSVPLQLSAVSWLSYLLRHFFDGTQSLSRMHPMADYLRPRPSKLQLEK